MGCYCCYNDCLEKLRADSAAIMINTQAETMHKEASDILAELKAIDVESFETDSVEHWQQGDSQSYQRFLVKLKLSKLKKERPEACDKRLTERHCKAAMHQALEYLKASGDEFTPPDEDWVRVVAVLGAKFGDIRSLEKRFLKLKEDHQQHLRDVETTLKQVESSSDYKVEYSRDRDRETEGKMKQIDPLLEKLLAVSKDCVAMLKAFYVELPEEEEKKEAEKPVAEERKEEARPPASTEARQEEVKPSVPARPLKEEAKATE